jgi:hypothetical protein
MGERYRYCLANIPKNSHEWGAFKMMCYLSAIQRVENYVVNGMKEELISSAVKRLEELHNS